MGMFMQSVSFHRPGDRDWKAMVPWVRDLLERYGQDPDQVRLEEDREFFCVFSPYGDMGPAVGELAQGISAITGDYVIAAQCVDSDFNLITLYRDGKAIDEGSSGVPDEDFLEVGAGDRLHPERWYPILKDPARKADLEHALLGEEVFAEALLVQLTELTGFPVFSYEMLEDLEDDF